MVESLVNQGFIGEDDLGQSTVAKVAQEVPRITKEGLHSWRRRRDASGNDDKTA